MLLLNLDSSSLYYRWWSDKLSYLVIIWWDEKHKIYSTWDCTCLLLQYIDISQIRSKQNEQAWTALASEFRSSHKLNLRQKSSTASRFVSSMWSVDFLLRESKVGLALSDCDNFLFYFRQSTSPWIPVKRYLQYPLTT